MVSWHEQCQKHLHGHARTHTHTHTYTCTSPILLHDAYSNYWFYLSIVYCPKLRDPDNGLVTCKVGHDGLPSFQETCDVMCNTGYAVNGSKTRMCQGDKTWSGDGICHRGKY